MLKIGVTGGIGSGKTVVCEIFKILGVAVYNADTEAKNITNSDSEIIQALTGRYGQDIYFNGEINKKKLSSIIFDNKEELNFINSTIHPRVFAHFNEWLELHNNHSYIIKEAALLFESGSYKDLDKIILVTAPEEIRIKRIIKRDNTNEDAIKKIIKNQLSEGEKINKSDYIINNDDITLVIPQVLELHNKFTH